MGIGPHDILNPGTEVVVGTKCGTIVSHEVVSAIPSGTIVVHTVRYTHKRKWGWAKNVKPGMDHRTWIYEELVNPKEAKVNYSFVVIERWKTN